MAHMLGIKLGSLFIKTITKPVANSLKKRAANPGVLRELCLRYGRFHHRVESRMQLRLLGLEPTKIKEISDETAIATGASVLSEAFVFTTAAGLLWFELARKAREDAKSKEQKEAKEMQEKQELEARFSAMEVWMKQEIQEKEKLQKELNEMRQRIDKAWIVG